MATTDITTSAYWAETIGSYSAIVTARRFGIMGRASAREFCRQAEGEAVEVGTVRGASWAVDREAAILALSTAAARL